MGLTRGEDDLLLSQTQVLSPPLIALPLPNAHLEGTLLPRGFSRLQDRPAPHPRQACDWALAAC